MHRNLFLDTNVLLSFYHFSKDDLEELKKLIALLKKSGVHLYLPLQVKNEFRRNREAKIKESLKKLEEQQIKTAFPEICKDYAEYKELQKLQEKYKETYSRLITLIRKDAKEVNLKADAIIAELFSLRREIKADDNILTRARTRIELGNPPGKNGSLGDAVNWEYLLAHAPNGESLHLITDDGDFASDLEPNDFNPFLADEWEERKKSKIVFYKHLSGFFKNEFPDIKLASEAEKDFLISKLASSSSFAMTHSVIAELKEFSDFTIDQTNRILIAAATNDQVFRIVPDPDVREFIHWIITGKEDHLNREALSSIEEWLDRHDKMMKEIEERNKSIEK